MLVSLFNKVTRLRSTTLLKRHINAGVSCVYCETFKNTYFEKHLRSATSNILSHICHAALIKENSHTMTKVGTLGFSSLNFSIFVLLNFQASLIICQYRETLTSKLKAIHFDYCLLKYLLVIK